MYLVRGELRRAHGLAKQLLQQARRSSDQALSVIAEYTLGLVSYYMGEFVLAREHCDIALSIYDPERHRPLAIRYFLVDPGVNLLLLAALNLWFLVIPIRLSSGAMKHSHWLKGYPILRVWLGLG